MKPEPVPPWIIGLTIFIGIGICCAGLILTGPMYVAYLPSMPSLPARAARLPTFTPIPTFTPLPLPPSSTPTAIAFKNIPGVAEYSLAMMDQQVIIHDSADRITGLFEAAVTSEQINTYDIMDEVENIRAAHGELRLLQPPPVLSQTHSGILTASEKCNRSMDYMAEWVEKARAGRGDEGEEFQEFGRLIIECRNGLNEVTTELVRQLQGSVVNETVPTPWITARGIPLIPAPTPTPSFTTTPTPSRTPTLWSISTVPAWPVVNPTFTPWVGPTATTKGGSSSGGDKEDKEDKEVEDDNDENDDADDDKGSGGIVCTCESNTLNCPDSGDKTAIRNCFRQCNDLGKGDVHDLDRNNDGIACND